MNQMVTTQLRRIEGAVEELQTVLQDLREDAHKQTLEREKLLQEQWGHRKQIAALSRAADDYDELAAECESLRETHRQIRAILQKVLSHTKALATEYMT